MAVKIQAVSPELTVSSAKAVIGAAIAANEPIKTLDRRFIANSPRVNYAAELLYCEAARESQLYVFCG